jgi:hypothetical protein
VFFSPEIFMRSTGVMLLLLAPAQAALAQSLPTASVFDALDKDQSDSISHGEAITAAEVAAKFVIADKNKDGMLSRAEFEAAFSKTVLSPEKPSQPRAPQP